MRNPVRECMIFAVALLAAGALAGCGNLSRDIARDGSGAQQLVWPKPGEAIALHRGGTFPNLDNLRQVRAGLTKNQVIALVGPPHFDEGFAGVREWNYLFNFRGEDGTVTQCGYKILFDENKLARSFYWHPASCADFPNPPAQVAHADVSFTLSADALFAFDKSTLGDIKPEGRGQLDALAEKLVAPNMQVGHVRVIGYTDRLGSDAHNLGLSERRAATVRDYLIGRGVTADRIEAEGRGAADPVKQCQGGRRAMLITCLAPNRRVVIEAEGTH